MKKIFGSRHLSILLLVGFALLFSVEAVNACSCVSPSLESAVEESPNIVILKLQSVEKYGENEKGYGVDGIKQSRLSVEKIFKGNLKIGQSLTFAQGGGADCVWTFDEERIGTEYLFFLGGKPEKNKLWTGFVCSRSNSVKGAAADLTYLEKLSKVRGKLVFRERSIWKINRRLKAKRVRMNGWLEER